LNFSGEDPNTTDFDSTRGYAFNITAAGGVTVTHLSFFDFGGNGLIESHEVGLWNSAGVLLASATVPAGVAAPLDSTGKFRIVPITPLLLPAGTGYAVGAVFLANSSDVQGIEWSSSSTASGITYVQPRLSLNGPGLVFPTVTGAFLGIPGGSFNIAPGGAAAAPEPGSLALLALTCLPLIGAAVRQKRCAM
jgi:hypothetical protein